MERRRQTERKANLLKAVQQDATKAWTGLPTCYQSDKEFILAALNNSKKLPNKTDFERQFSRSLRADRDIVLAFAKRRDFEKLYHERLLFVPDYLTQDKEIMLAYCQKIARSLQDCTEELCDDRDVVEAAVTSDGMSLQYASDRLRCDRDLVIRACCKNSRALEFCRPGPVRDELTSNRAFMLSIVRKKDGGPMLRLASNMIKHDRELVLEAVVNGHSLSFCPEEFQTDEAFVLKALSRKADIYLQIKSVIKTRLAVVLASINSESTTCLVQKAALENTSPANRQQVALAIAERAKTKDCLEFIMKAMMESKDSKTFQDDKILMLTWIKRNCKLLSFVGEDLRKDPDILLAAIDEETAAFVLETTPGDVRLEHPAITIRALEKATLAKPLQAHIPTALWKNRSVCLAWIKRGGEVLDSFSSLLSHDQDFCLAVAEHCHWSNFSKIDVGFRGNAAFIVRAIQVAKVVEQLETYIPVHLFRIRAVCLQWVRRGAPVLEVGLFSTLLREDEEFALEVATNCSWSEFSKIGDVFKHDINFMLRVVPVAKNVQPLARYVPSELWQDRSFCLLWIRSGGFVEDSFSRLLLEDEAFALEIAQHCHWSEFSKVSSRLRRNVNFMMQAVGKDGRVLRFVGLPLKEDLQRLAIRALTNHPAALRNPNPPEREFGFAHRRVENRALHPAFFRNSHGRRFTYGEQVAIRSHIKRKLDLQKTFMNEFLRGIAIVMPPLIPPAQRSQLPMLDRRNLGDETSQAFKQRIAEYLGVPIGAEFRSLKKAWRNLQKPPNENDWH